MSSNDTDFHLLFGILAYQFDFIDRSELIAAIRNWIGHKDSSLADLLVERGALSARDRELLEPMVHRHVQLHGGEAAASLGALSSAESARSELSEIADPDIERSVACLSEGPVSHDPDGTISPDPHRLGRAGDRFRIVRFHARGGLGKISVAIDDELHREVALKEILPERSDDPDKRLRFLHEAEITGNLEHPGIVPVYGLGKYEDGRPFYAMRFVRGDSLRTAVRRFHAKDSQGLQAGERGLELRKLLQRFIDVCEAVEYAHSRGVLHRDLKPGNIMLGKFGETLVVDWGLAKTVGTATTQSPDEEPSIHPTDESDSAPTQMGTAVGTREYMSPEQAAGRLDLLGPETDVFGLGATLYALLTGTAPYDTNLSDIMQRIEQAEFPRPREHSPQIPVALEAVCLKAMSRRPADRYGSPHGLAEELERWLADEPVRARREPLLARIRRWTTRHLPTVAALTTLVIVLVAVATATGVYSWRQLESQRQKAKLLMSNAQRSSRESDWLQASRLFGQAAGTSSRYGRLQSIRQEAETRLAQINQHRSFLKLAAATLSEGIHALRDEREPDKIAAQARAALALYRGTEARNWNQVFAKTLLTDRQTRETKAVIGKLLDQLGLRLALYDTKDEQGVVATEEALRLFDLADRLRPPSMGIWMARMLFNRRLDRDSEADHAGEKMTAMAREGKITATDKYLTGIFSLKVIKDAQAASGILDQAIAMEPNNYGAHFARFQAAGDLGDIEGQISELSVCLALRPDDAELYYFRGFMRFSRGDHLRAGLDFDQCVHRDPSYSQGHYWRGRVLIMNEEWEAAERAFSRAIQLDERAAPNILTWRALVRSKQGKHEAAFGDSQQVPVGERDEDSLAWRILRTLSLCVHAARDEEPTNQELAKRYSDQAMETLMGLAERGYFSADKNMVSLLSHDLDGLRSDTRYQQWEREHLADVVDGDELPRSPDLLSLRAMVLVGRGDHKRAAESAARLQLVSQQLGRLPGQQKRFQGHLYDVGCCFALCAKATDVSPENDEQKRQSEVYRGKAMEALGQAIRMGYRDARHLQEDPDLEFLHGKPGWEQLVAELSASAPSPGKSKND